MSEKTTREARADYWRAHIEAWRASGQSQRSYCLANGLGYSNFLYWRRRLRSGHQTHRHGRGAGFVPVAYAVSASGEGLLVALPNGVELRGIDADNLALVEQLLNRWS